MALNSRALQDRAIQSLSALKLDRQRLQAELAAVEKTIRTIEGWFESDDEEGERNARTASPAASQGDVAKRRLNAIVASLQKRDGVAAMPEILKDVTESMGKVSRSAVFKTLSTTPDLFENPSRGLWKLRAVTPRHESV